jgi:uncharacterized protein (DUF1501 family)
MTTDIPTKPRREFLKRALSLTAGSAIAPWALNFAALGEAVAASATDYKALVCVFLYGGNDYANTLVAYDPPSYAKYLSVRSNLAYPYANLANTVLNPVQAPVDSSGAARQYALAPELSPLLPIFNSGHMGVLLNVGNLIQPVTKAQYRANSVPLPVKLFSHNDQQSEWQSSGSEGTTTGWAGRMEDLLLSGNSNPVFSCVNVYGNAVFLSGLAASQYQITTSGPVGLNAMSSLFGSPLAARTLQSIMTEASRYPLEADYAHVVSQALSANQLLTNGLASAPPLRTVFPAGNNLADQLKMVAHTASIASALGVKRQVFFVALNGFDNHDSLATAHPKLLTSVATAMSSFYQATVELGLASAITAFTASDFGRTLSVNNDGSDHGWGSMHFMLGDAVKGQQYYGTPPVVAVDGPDDVGQGRLLPTTSVDQYAATLGKWFGLTDTQLVSVLPNLSNHLPASRDLGFMSA